MQGDVGSGKTVVAMLAMADVAAAGAAVGADGARPRSWPASTTRPSPRRWPATASRRVLLTGRDKGAGRAEKLAALAGGSAAVAVGTHALFQDDVAFHALALTVIDEQHRFGVNERGAAAGQGRGRAPAGHVGDADPAHPGADRVRRPRRLADRREAARPHAGRHPRRADAAGRRDRGAAADRDRRRRPGVLDLPAGLGVRERRPGRRRGARGGAAARCSGPGSAWSTASCPAPRRTR